MAFKKLLTYFKQHTLLKITSLNSIVIAIRLVISFFIQNLLAETIGAAGIAKVGQIRSVLAMLTSASSFGIFNGIVKYTAELKDEKEQLQKMFSMAFIFLLLGTIISAFILFAFSESISVYLFGNNNYVSVIKILAFIVPAIALTVLFKGVLNGLTAYKKYAKIELVSYLLSSILLIASLLKFSLLGVLIAIALTPLLQLLVIVFVFGKTLKQHINFKGVKWNTPFAKALLTFTIMSVISTILLNYIEIDIRAQITDKINEAEAGYWTAMLFISKNYMVFSTGLFTLYVMPKFAGIYDGKTFKKQVIYIYKTLLPLFGLGMLLIYLFRHFLIAIIYPGFEAMEPLFKWQLLGDFVKLIAVVLSYQFIAKKMLLSFAITEITSLLVFYFLSMHLVDLHGTEGVAMAHLYRYIVYFILVLIAIWYHFKNNNVLEHN